MSQNGRNQLSPRRFRFSRTAIHGFALVLTTLVLGGPFPVGAQSNAAAGRPVCDPAAARVKMRLSDLIRTQQSDGRMTFHGADGMLDRQPMLATIALQSYRHDRDVEFLREVYDAAKKQIGLILVTSDADADFLMERTTWDSNAFGGSIEGVGYNALFALDMLAISDICGELGERIDALFWYQGWKTVSSQLIAQTYDSESGYFLPMDNVEQRQRSLYFALSALPVYCRDRIGDNLSSSVIRNYLLKNQDLKPEVPNHYLDWAMAGDRLADGVSAEFALRTLVLLGSLHRNGLVTEASRFAEEIGGHVEARKAAGTLYAHADEQHYTDYITCLIASGGYRTLFPRYQALKIFNLLGGLNGVLEAEEALKLHSSVAMIEGFLLELDGAGAATRSVADLDAVERSIRNVYWTISSLREKWRTRTLFTPRDRSQVPGFDIYAAFDELADDVILTLRTAENKLTTERDIGSGFRITATLVNELSVTGAPLNFRIGLSAMNTPLAIKSLVIFCDHAMDTLLAANRVVELNKEQREFWYRYRPPAGAEASILPVRFSAHIQFSDGSRTRYHFNKGVYMTRPVSYTASFPGGKTLTGGSIPVEIHVKKHVPDRLVVNAVWFSPAGLNLKEGRTIEALIPDDVKAAKMQMNVLVPTPCRPGSFPFLIKLFGNGVEAGTVAGNLFRHYEWLFVGPFPKMEEGLDAVYPPEMSVNLRDGYRGAIRRITWSALPQNAYREDGEIELSALLPQESLGYLYTVIKTPSEKETSITFHSTSPAMIFVNGEEVLRHYEPSSGSPQRVGVSLKQGMNNVMIKLASADEASLFFQLGDEEDLTSDEFNNNLWELVDGYQDLLELARNRYSDNGDISQVVTLTYHNPEANSVAVIGSFNGWSPVDAGMRSDRPGEWEISLHLTPGRYAYRFLVNNRAQITDPSCSFEEPDGYGGRNSVLFVR